MGSAIEKTKREIPVDRRLRVRVENLEKRLCNSQQ